MSWWDILKDVFSSLREAVDVLRTRRRRKLHLFVMKAIALREYPNLQHVHYRPLSELTQKIYLAQIEDAAGGKETLARAFIEGTASTEQEKAFQKKLKAQTRLGLPQVNDPRREEKVEKILQEMVEAEKLSFAPQGRGEDRSRRRKNPARRCPKRINRYQQQLPWEETQCQLQ